MTATDRPAFAACLAMCAEAFGEPLSEPRLESYFRALADLRLEEVEQAVAAAIRTARFFPKPSELRDLVHGSLDDDADGAWLALLAAARPGYWADPIFDGATAAAIVAAFGTWIACVDAFCDLPEPAWQAKRKEFLAAYRLIRRREAEQAPKALTGMIARQNAIAGWTPGRLTALREAEEPKALTQGTAP